MADISIVNSSKYWDGRFSSDWEAFQGPAQSRFFARLAIQRLPRWFVEHLRRESLTIADWGCAQGDGTDVWAGFLAPQQIAGVDFSAVAIEQAARRYPAIRFIAEDWLADNCAVPDSFDFVFSSNTLEHFHKPYDVLRVLSQHARKGVVIALPFREDNRISEHYFSFRQDNVPLMLDNGFRLIHADVVDCRSQPDAQWDGEQIILLYAEQSWVEAASNTAKEIVESVSVTLTKSAILVEGNPVVGVHGGAIDASDKASGDVNGLVITPLLNALNERAVLDKKIAALKGEMFEGAATIIADKTTPYRLLTEVMYTAGEAEYKKYRLIVLQKRQ